MVRSIFRTVAGLLAVLAVDAGSTVPAGPGNVRPSCRACSCPDARPAVAAAAELTLNGIGPAHGCSSSRPSSPACTCPQRSQDPTELIAQKGPRRLQMKHARRHEPGPDDEDLPGRHERAIWAPRSWPRCAPQLDQLHDAAAHRRLCAQGRQHRARPRSRARRASSVNGQPRGRADRRATTSTRRLLRVFVGERARRQGPASRAAGRV